MCCVDRKLANYQEAEWSSASGLEKHYQELEAHYSSAEGGAPLHVYLTSYTMYNTVCTSSYLTLPRKWKGPYSFVWLLYFVSLNLD